MFPGSQWGWPGACAGESARESPRRSVGSLGDRAGAWSGHWEAGAAPRRPHPWGPEKAASAFWKSESPRREPHLQSPAPVRRKRPDSVKEQRRVRRLQFPGSCRRPFSHSPFSHSRRRARCMLELIVQLFPPTRPNPHCYGDRGFFYHAHRCKPSSD